MKRLAASLTLLLAVFIAIASLPRPDSNAGKRCGRVVGPQTVERGHRQSLDELFLSPDVPKPIPDLDTAVSVLEIPSNEDTIIQDVNVLVTITHTWIRDLRISLIAPDSTEVLLLTLFPGDSAVNMTNCWFDDEAGEDIYEGQPPFSGSFRPLGSLDTLDGKHTAGTWRLQVVDQFRLDSGRIEAWGLDINPVLNLRGVVRNRSTRVAINKVRVTVAENGQRTFTDTTGLYGFSGLAPGTYTLRFSTFDSLAFRSASPTVAIRDTSTASLTVEASVFDSLWVSGVEVVEGSTTIVDTSLAPLSIADLDVTVNITHSSVGDLTLTLFGPAGQQVELVHVGDTCYSIGANMVNCRFDDEAARAFSEGRGPFTGSWRPYDTLSAFNGRRQQGQWQLQVYDNCLADTGRFQNFTLHIQLESAQSAPLHKSGPPETPAFHGNYPNPFNSSTTFTFDLPNMAHTRLAIYNLLGQEVAVVTSDVLHAGSHSVGFDARRLPSGIYFARLSTPSFSQTRKIVLLR